MWEDSVQAQAPSQDTVPRLCKAVVLCKPCQQVLGPESRLCPVLSNSQWIWKTDCHIIVLISNNGLQNDHSNLQNDYFFLMASDRKWYWKLFEDVLMGVASSSRKWQI